MSRVKVIGLVMAMMIGGFFNQGCISSSMREWAAEKGKQMLAAATKAGGDKAEEYMEGKRQEEIRFLGEQLGKFEKTKVVDPITNEKVPVYWSLRDFDLDQDDDLSVKELSAVTLKLQALNLQKIAQARAKKRAAEQAKETAEKTGDAAGVEEAEGEIAAADKEEKEAKGDMATVAKSAAIIGGGMGILALLRKMRGNQKKKKADIAVTHTQEPPPTSRKARS